MDATAVGDRAGDASPMLFGPAGTAATTGNVRRWRDGDEGAWLAVGFNAAHWLVDRHLSHGDGARVAIRVEGSSFTYRQVSDAMHGVADALAERGVRPGDVVLLLLVDGVEFATAFLGAMSLGAVPAPVNPQQDPVVVEEIRRRTGARVCMLSASRSRAARHFPAEVDVFVAGTADVGTAATVRQWPNPRADDGRRDPSPVGPDAIGFLLATSGTSGRPKLVPHTHIDLRTSAESYAWPVLGIGPDDRCYSTSPMFHAYGLGNVLTFPFSVGATAILDPWRPVTPAQVAETCAAEGPTLFFSTPTLYSALARSGLAADAFASVRAAVSAGEALSAELWHRVRDGLGLELLDGLGSTEATHIYLSNRPGAVAPGTVGTPVDTWQFRLAGGDAGGEPAPPGSPGRLWIRGPSLTAGYWHDEEVNRTRFDAGWFDTGDMFAVDHEGRYHYMGRADEMLRVHGEWVTPTEIEEVVREHPSVADVAVVGLSGADGLTVVTAFVVAAEEGGVTADEILARCAKRLPGYKRPRAVVFRDALPTTATGKVQRMLLREDATLT